MAILLFQLGLVYRCVNEKGQGRMFDGVDKWGVVSKDSMLNDSAE